MWRGQDTIVQNDTKIQLCKMIQDTREIKNENRIFEKRLLEYLDQREPVTYHCSLCKFGSGYRDKITKHMVKKHMKDCKGPDLEDNVEDCAYCRKYFSSVEDFKKHQEET